MPLLICDILEDLFPKPCWTPTPSRILAAPAHTSLPPQRSFGFAEIDLQNDINPRALFHSSRSTPLFEGAETAARVAALADSSPSTPLLTPSSCSPLHSA
jgi:hypothetical protein